MSPHAPHHSTHRTNRQNRQIPPMSRRAFTSSAVGGAALGGATILGLTSCQGSGGSAGADHLRIVDYYNTPSDDVVISKTFDEATQKVGVEYTREKFPGDQLIAKVLQMGSSHSMPDILMLDGPDLQQVAESGALTPLSDYGISTDGFSDQVANVGMYDGKLYGIAPCVNTIALFYDAAALDRAGMSPPGSWDDLRETAKELTGNGRYGLAFSAIATYEGAFQFLPFMWSNGGDETQLSEPEVYEASAFWAELLGDGSVSRSVVNWGQGDVMDQFKAGNAAMCVNGPWNVPGLASDTPDLDWDVAILPPPSSKDDSVAPLGGEVWTIPATGDDSKQQKAGEVLKEFVSPAHQLTMAAARSTIPGDEKAAAQFADEHQELRTFVEQAASARSRTAKLGPLWPKTAKGIYTANQKVLVDGTDPREAFEYGERTIR
jgi:multiple sugar transport system substrate-binding protein